MVKWIAVIAVLLLAGCAAPEGPLCESDSDCATSEICLGSGGVFFGGSYCAPLGNADAGVIEPEPDAGGQSDTGECRTGTCNFTGSMVGVCATGSLSCEGLCQPPATYEAEETTCDGLDNDCDGIVDEGQALAGTVVSAGGSHTCALDAEGAAYCWGRNSDGQLGTGDFDDSTQPRTVAAAVAMNEISAGAAHTCGIEVDSGAIYCWGRNDSRQVADVNDPSLATPARIEPRSGAPWRSIAAGRGFTCAVSSGTVFCWGANDLGQSGQPASETVSTPTAIQVAQDVTFDRVVAGDEHACAWMTNSSTAFCWGNPADGRLVRPESSGSAPAQIPLSGTAPTFLSFDAGADHTCATVAIDDGSGNTVQGISCAGSNATGQLGTDPSAGGPNPVPVGQSLAQGIALGTGFSCAYETPGGVGCWGENADGQANPSSMDSPVLPTVLTEISPDNDPNVASLSAGGRHACAVTGETVTCWGSNESGQLGADSPDAFVTVGCAL